MVGDSVILIAIDASSQDELSASISFDILCAVRELMSLCRKWHHRLHCRCRRRIESPIEVVRKIYQNMLRLQFYEK